jgi:hypothetical protein
MVKQIKQDEKTNNLKHPKCINCKRFARHHLRIKQDLNLRKNISNFESFKNLENSTNFYKINFEILKKPENDTISSCDDCLDLAVQILRENIMKRK